MLEGTNAADEGGVPGLIQPASPSRTGVGFTKGLGRPQGLGQLVFFDDAKNFTTLSRR